MFKPVTLEFSVYYVIYPVPPFSDASGYLYTVIFTKVGINQQIGVLLYNSMFLLIHGCRKYLAFSCGV